MNTQPTGSASWYPATKLLKIVTKAKRGPKIVDHVETYEVEPFETHPGVARYGYTLTKQSDGKTYEIGVTEYGAVCSCPHHQFHPNGGDCKHLRAAKAVKLLR